MPIRLEIWIDLAVDQKNAGRSLLNPGTHRIQISETPHGCGPRAIAAGDSSEIRFRKLYNIDRITLPAKEVHFGRI